MKASPAMANWASPAAGAAAGAAGRTNIVEMISHTVNSKPAQPTTWGISLAPNSHCEEIARQVANIAATRKVNAVSGLRLAG